MISNLVRSIAFFLLTTKQDAIRSSSHRNVDTSNWMCGSSWSKKTKYYYYSFENLAVHFVNNPENPTLRIFPGQAWSIGLERNLTESICMFVAKSPTRKIEICSSDPEHIILHWLLEKEEGWQTKKVQYDKHDTDLTYLQLFSSEFGKWTEKVVLRDADQVAWIRDVVNAKRGQMTLNISFPKAKNREVLSINSGVVLTPKLRERITMHKRSNFGYLRDGTGWTTLLVEGVHARGVREPVFDLRRTGFKNPYKHGCHYRCFGAFVLALASPIFGSIEAGIEYAHKSRLYHSESAGLLVDPGHHLWSKLKCLSSLFTRCQNKDGGLIKVLALGSERC